VTESRFELPFERLPRGFVEAVAHPTSASVAARPAATVVLLRDADHALEVLLLRRSHDARFVPGAYVFPGGRLDDEDRDPALAERTDGLTPRQASRRLGVEDEAEAMAYYVAAVREAFEETGILVGRLADGGPSPTAAVDAATESLRKELLDGRRSFAGVLDALGCRLDGSGVEYIDHWITPESEPHRYDTRFFVARVAEDARSSVHRREMTEALWLTPFAALERNRRGELPMVFPTIRTLERLAAFEHVTDALGELARHEVPTIRPRLHLTRTGVAITLADPADTRSEQP
jgi:8-oxo-dGTP pyrophosphatase MutT (NUDIX family)